MTICKKAVLVPFCLIASGIQAKATIGSNEWRQLFIELLLQYKVDIIPFPCSEVTFGGLSEGLVRKPHGIDYYNKLGGYREHCQQLAICTEKVIVELEKGGYSIIAVLGIEHSPSCAVNYIYSHKGMLKCSGIFIEMLRQQRQGGSLPYIGINRRFPQKSYEHLRARLEFCQKQLGGEINDDYV